MEISNLPPNPTPFLGRVDELAEITRLLSDPTCRLLTLVGPGGIGKTRLAVAAAARAEAFPDGIVFAPLQPLGSADFIVPAIADALNFSFYGEQDPKTQLLTYIREKYLLLILDNFEHLLDGADLLLEILAYAPAVRLLVTSRERLRLREEWVLNVRGLPFPEDNATALEDYTAVQLFVQQSRRVGYAPVEADAASIARICRLVEGIPLAIELAAAWARVMPCAEIAREIESSLDILTTILRNLPDKHRSMRAVFEHSWKLLSEDEQAVFRKLAVFRGGFTREAAEQVACASLPALSLLVDKSLIRVNANGRYDLHELLRQFADEHLNRSVEGNRTRDAHCAYYAEFLYRIGTDLKGPNQIKALSELEAELDNARTTWRWAVEQGKEQEILQAIDSFALFYQIRSRFHEGEETFEMAVKRLGDVESALLGQLLLLQGWFTHFGNRLREGRELFRKGMPILLRFGLHELMGMLFGSLWGRTGQLGGEEEAQRLLRECLTLFSQRGERWKAAWVLHGLGWVIYGAGNKEEAWRREHESLALFRALGDRWGATWALNTLGDWAMRQGAYHEAQRFFEESLMISEEIGDMGGVGWALGRLSSIADSLEEYDNFRKYYTETLKARLRLGFSWLVADHEVYLMARWLDLQGQTERAVEMFAFCHNSPDIMHQDEIKDKAAHRLVSLRDSLPPEVFTAATQRGETSDLATISKAIIEQLFTLEAGAEVTLAASVAASRPADQSLIEPLSSREMEILHLIADGFSNREIADQLVLALSTVKWHIRQIFGKLSATNRTEAVARARTLKLLV